MLDLQKLQNMAKSKIEVNIKLQNMAKSKIEETSANSSNKPQVEIENEVFDELMYDKDKVNQKPIGYGFGVKQSDAIGVHALLQKRGISSNHNNENQDLQAEFSRHKKQTANLVRKMATQMSELLSAMESGRVSPEMLAAANSSLRSITNQSNQEASNERSEDEDESDDE